MGSILDETKNMADYGRFLGILKLSKISQSQQIFGFIQNASHFSIKVGYCAYIDAIYTLPTKSLHLFFELAIFAKISKNQP